MSDVSQSYVDGIANLRMPMVGASTVDPDNVRCEVLALVQMHRLKNFDIH